MAVFSNIVFIQSLVLLFVESGAPVHDSSASELYSNLSSTFPGMLAGHPLLLYCIAPGLAPNCTTHEFSSHGHLPNPLSSPVPPSPNFVSFFVVSS